MPNQNQTSYGQTLLREQLLSSINGTPLENHRPDWLFGMELDFFYPEHQLAFEFQGDQHFIPVYGGLALAAQKSRDVSKRRICRERGIVLVNVEAWELVKLKIKSKLFACANSYLNHIHPKARRAWVKSVLNGFSRRRQNAGTREMREAAKSYQAHIANKYGGITTIPRKFNRKRAAAIAEATRTIGR